MPANRARRASADGTHVKLAAVDVPALEHPAPLPDLDGALLESAARNLLVGVGEDPSRDGLIDTPVRVRKSLELLTEGYRLDPREVVGDALFEVEYDELVLLRDIEVYSLCEHHLLPFFGKCHVAYIPQGRVIGLSKIPRVVEIFSRRLQVQERLTNQIAETIREKVRPLGVAIVMEASHLCMSMRGVEKQNSVAVTSAMLGVFQHDARTRMEFLDLIRRGDAERSPRASITGVGCT